MSIKVEELNLLRVERQIKVEYVFLEKADHPTSRTGAGIPAGILLLTDKRLYFFSIREGKSTVGKLGIKFATDIADHFTFGLASLVEYGIEKGIEYINSENYEDYKLYSQEEESFVVPIERIANCEKFGGTFSLSPKSRYVKLTLLDEFEKRSSYCIYSINPKNQQSTIKYEKWFEKIEDARKITQHGQFYRRSAV
jgi:hypothetical protein